MTAWKYGNGELTVRQTDLESELGGAHDLNNVESCPRDVVTQHLHLERAEGREEGREEGRGEGGGEGGGRRGGRRGGGGEGGREGGGRTLGETLYVQHHPYTMTFCVC